MTTTVPLDRLPAVEFAGIGRITAAAAVRITDQRDNDRTGEVLTDRDVDGRFSVAILHPDGGRIRIDGNLTGIGAAGLAEDLANVLLAWARLHNGKAQR